MLKRLLQTAAVVTLLISFIPAQVLADAAVVQDSCYPYFEGGKAHCTIYFTVVNASLDVPICDLHFIPEIVTPGDECKFVGCGAAEGWWCELTGTTDHTAHWYAYTPDDCIAPGTMKSGFSFDLDPTFCCYWVQFTGPDGGIIEEQEECFIPCYPSSADGGTWGILKALYR